MGRISPRRSRACAGRGGRAALGHFAIWHGRAAGGGVAAVVRGARTSHRVSAAFHRLAAILRREEREPDEGTFALRLWMTVSAAARLSSAVSSPVRAGPRSPATIRRLRATSSPCHEGPPRRRGARSRARLVRTARDGKTYLQAPRGRKAAREGGVARFQPGDSAHRLCAGTLSASQAALAPKRPEGMW